MLQTDLAPPPPGNAPFTISVNPATGEEVGRYPCHDVAAQDAVLDAARDAQRNWGGIDAQERERFFVRLGAVLRDRIDLLAGLITAEMGKPVTAAKAEIEKCAFLCDWYAENAATLLRDEEPDVGGNGAARVVYQPLGTILGVMPWNFPFWQVLRAAVPIMAAGNAFVLKHADNVQGSARALADAFDAAAFPAGLFGVLNVRRHDLSRLIADSRIAAVTVTAGAAAGAAIAADAGRNLKKSLLELGGTDPFIVLADADLDRAVEAAVTARFQNCGQVCIAAKRLIVERPVLAAFTERFVAAVRKLVQGDPGDAATQLGPMARDRARQELHAQVAESVRRGATVLLGGEVPEGAGYYYPATVLTDITPDMPVFREETFGPVAPIIVAEDAEDAIRIANDSDFGLAGALWSSDAAKAHAIAKRLETGGVFINGIAASDPRVPIGGIKASGFGRELSHFGLREFCNAKLVWARD
ncbi:succinate-semialdehyde dehydrogenase [Sphingobium amiense]|uniref:Succinate-semialdehyde dehydrogenase n=1 Tax=Sphingobium amiense TaxID=135719 RepID=A0A494W6I1_9SPHN|nr:aldehyde dehydrogenase family protein [Sphingobium amiense]BBD99861.1 succinate-semialdehyde dehydrogenase [Sphingobium amiense]